MSALICPICLQSCTVLNKHHILPRCYGSNPDSPLLELCENCHKAIHYTAEAEYVGKKMHYLLPEQRVRADVYVEAIKRAKAIYESAEGTRNLDKKITLHLPEVSLTKLHKLKADRGFKSLDALLKDMIYRELRKM